MPHLIKHPLALHVIARLREKTTKPAEFRSLCHHLSMLLALEATRDLAMREVAVNTPLEACIGHELARPLVVVPILRAGLGMVEPIVAMFPDVSVGYIGLERDHETAMARNYYCKMPPLAGTRVMVVDPMLATGGSAVQAIDVVKQKGGGEICMLNVVAAPEGVKAVKDAHPDVPIYTCALDRALNDRKYILPGLGDFGDRLYGT
ncbi:uracil phosphoribosyltransferase [Ereboglobus sp. PH5-5]|uniref:uracil phosphoribosyltransferase n=1 Tax=unclassified Ereboglobus TaxID=2626932 RepID=UPI002404F490|nr:MULTISPECIES: uracil phosphoribosyltransferase [unclassified Ereboglobus]MDF9827361.1 uracil phosphoribosyltransferase [Ereboglobus sp. PH5-10]MDF9833925.1 uracil phosphoribosyltransferase [Ereboglobus sp. PH5-5]